MKGRRTQRLTKWITGSPWFKRITGNVWFSLGVTIIILALWVGLGELLDSLGVPDWVGKVLNMIFGVAFFFSLMSFIIRSVSKLQEKRRVKYPRIRQMRNYSGGANIYLKALGWSLFALFFASALGFSMMVIGLQFSLWWLVVGLLIFGGLFYLIGRWRGLWKIWRDLYTVAAEGGTTTAWKTGFDVEDESFKVDEEISDWLQTGDEVVVHYWPHSKTVARVEKL